LIVTSNMNFTEIIELLIEKGANVNAQDKPSGFVDIIEILEENWVIIIFSTLANKTNVPTCSPKAARKNNISIRAKLAVSRVSMVVVTLAQRIVMPDTRSLMPHNVLPIAIVVHQQKSANVSSPQIYSKVLLGIIR